MQGPSAAPLLLLASLCALAAAQQPDDFGPPGMFPGGPDGPGPMVRGDLEVLQNFDANGDGRLDVEERKDARAWLHDNRQQRGPGGPGGRGGFPGFAGDDREPFDPSRKGQSVRPDEVATFPDRELFDPDVVRTIFLQFPQADWYEELTDFYRTDVDIPATVVVDGTTYREVGVHMRGNTSFQGVRTKKKSLHLDFDFTVAGQELYSHSATNLINNHEDPSLLHEVLGAFVANRHTQAPRANLVRVVVNGEDFGVYSNVEHFDKDFLEQQFGSKKGTRFKVPPDFSGGAALKDLGDDLAAYRRAYTIKSKDDPAAWQSLRELCGLLANATDAQLVQQLPQRLDLDGTLWFLACDNALLDGDGYYSRGSDYSLWLDGDGRFHVVPRDGNEVLGSGGGPGGPGGPGGRFGPGGQRAGEGGDGPPRGDRPFPDGPGGAGARGQGPGGRRGGRGPGGRGGMRMPTVDQPALAMQDDPTRPLIRRLLGIPQWRERYLAFLHTLATESLDPKVLAPRIESWRRAIEPLVRIDVQSLDGFAAFEQAFADAPRSLLTVLRTRHQKLLADPALQGPWPQLGKVEHAFVGAPGQPAALRVTARTDDASVVAMTLHVGTGKLSPFAAVAMFDDGQHGDGRAGDRVFGGETDAFEPGTKVRFYVEAATPAGRVVCEPSSGGVRPTVVQVPGERKKKGKGKADDDRDG